MAKIQKYVLDVEIGEAASAPSELLLKRTIDDMLGTVEPSPAHFEELASSRDPKGEPIHPLPYVLTSRALGPRRFELLVLEPDGHEDTTDTDWLERLVDSQREWFAWDEGTEWFFRRITATRP